MLIKFRVRDVAVEMEYHGGGILSWSPFSGFVAVPFIMSLFPTVVALV